MFGFLISDKQNSRKHSSNGAPLFFMCSYWAVYLLLYSIFWLKKIPKVCSNVNKNDIQIINYFILMVCQNKIAKKAFKKQPSHLTTPLRSFWQWNTIQSYSHFSSENSQYFGADNLPCEIWDNFPQRHFCTCNKLTATMFEIFIWLSSPRIR